MRNPIKSIRIIRNPIVIAKKSDSCVAGNCHISAMQFVGRHDIWACSKSFMNKLCQACFSIVGGVQYLQVNAEKNETYSLVNMHRTGLQRKHPLQASLSKRKRSVTTYASCWSEKTMELLRVSKDTLNNIFNRTASKKHHYNLINFICRRFITFTIAKGIFVDSSYQFELQSNFLKCKMDMKPHWRRAIACLQMNLHKSQNNKRVPIFYSKVFCLKPALFERYPLYLGGSGRFVFLKLEGSVKAAASS